MSREKLVLILGALSLVFFGCEEIFERNLYGEIVTLVAPTNDVVSSEIEHQFTWDRLDGLSEYQLQIVTPTFDSIAALIIDTVTASNLVRVTLSRGHQYQWRVRAMNSAYSSLFSKPWTLTIQ